MRKKCTSCVRELLHALVFFAQRGHGGLYQACQLLCQGVRQHVHRGDGGGRLLEFGCFGGNAQIQLCIVGNHRL